MKSTKGKLGILLLALSLVAGGCGEKPMTLTKEEEAVIVSYAAHVVSKFNTRQPDGLVHVPEEVYQEKTSAEEPKERDTENEIDAQDTENGSDGQDTQGDGAAWPSDGQNGDAQGDASESAQGVSLTEALGFEGLTVECSDIQLSPSYVKPDFYSLDAAPGKTFLIINFLLTNTSDKDIDCDMLSRRVGFSAEVNGSVRAAAKTTILLNDLGTYQGIISAGQSAEAVLLFEVPADIAQIDSLKLTLEAGGISKEAIL